MRGDRGEVGGEMSGRYDRVRWEVEMGGRDEWAI
jgi:hypothetical protein